MMDINPRPKISRLGPGIVHVTYPTYYDLGMAFVRFSEFYESDNPNFRGHFFDLESYMNWYAHNRGKGHYTYTDDWSGFNIPGKIIIEFMRKCPRNSIRQKEWDLLKALESVGLNVLSGDCTDQFCVLGTIESVKSDTFKHECRHALYYLDATYREAVIKCIAQYPLIGLRRYLRTMGYCVEVITDEVNAYVTSGLDPGMPRSLTINKLRGELLAIPVPTEYEMIFRNT